MRLAPTLFFAAAMVGVAACARVAAKAPEHGGHSAATPPAATARAPEAKSEPPSAPAPAPRDDRADDPARIALTERYMAFLSGAKTPAGAIGRLGERARQSGAVVLPAEKLAPGARYLMADGTDLALIATGTEPLSAGVRIIVTFVDPPAVRLASSPPENRSGVITGDLVVDEGIDLGAWLSRPLAFYVSWARRGQTVIAVIGDSPGEPAFVFPDLLPHLSRKVQRRGPVDRPQRVDVLLAPSLKFLRRGLSAHKIPAAALAQGEVILAPAAPPVRVGATGDLLAAYGQAPLAVTFVAADALLSATTPPAHTAIVIATTARTGGHAQRFVDSVLERLSAMAEKPADALALRQLISRSAALMYAPGKGDLGDGVILNFRRDDTLPSAQRLALKTATAAGAEIHIATDNAWSSTVRSLGRTGMSVVGFALPVRAPGHPLSLISTRDLYQGALLCHAWLAP